MSERPDNAHGFGPDAAQAERADRTAPAEAPQRPQPRGEGRRAEPEKGSVAGQPRARWPLVALAIVISKSIGAAW